MALADFTFYENDGNGFQGSRRFAVQSQSTLTPYINAGEPVLRSLGATAYVLSFTASVTSKPVVGTDYLAGVSMTSSTETSSTDGIVDVAVMSANQSFLVNPDVAATYGVGATPVQATYDALIGSRVLLKTSAAVNGVITYTLLASDSANNGCVVLPLDVTKFPGKVRIAFRTSLNFLD